MVSSNTSGSGGSITRQTANNTHRRGGRTSCTGEYNQNKPRINIIMSPSNRSSSATVAPTGTNGGGHCGHGSMTPIPTPSRITPNSRNRTTPHTPKTSTPTTSYSTPNATRGTTTTITPGIKRRMYLIRHGESKGQRASSRQARRTDEKLVDCGLTRNGMEQAKFIPQLMALEGVDPIQLVVTSPLTRAIHTTLLAFPTNYHTDNNNIIDNNNDIGNYLDEQEFFPPSGNDNDDSDYEDMEIHNENNEDEDMEVDNNLVEEDTAPSLIPRTGVPILMAYDLREVGSMIPENRPRKFEDIWFDLDVDRTTQDRFDLQSLLFQTEQNNNPVFRSSPGTPAVTTTTTTTPVSSSTASSSSSSSSSPSCWPRGHDTPPKVVRKDRIRQVFAWLAMQLPTRITTLAVICHHNVIQTALSGASNPIIQNCPISPTNAQPIECTLHEDGQVELLRVLGE